MPKANPRPEIDIGGRLKVARMYKRLSQRELARKSGVTNGTISQIEQNQSSPSVASLKRILDAIPMTMSAFFSDEFDAIPQMVFRADQLHEISPHKIFPGADASGKISLRQVGNSAASALQIIHERYAPGSDTGETLYSHDAEEGGLLISGQIEITIGTAVFDLGPGDAYLFDSRLPHRFRNTGTEDCVIVSACTPPSF